MRDLFRPSGGRTRLTWRLLGVILDGLPGDSLYKTAVRNSIPEQDLAELAAEPTTAGHGRWTHTDMLLADIIDRLGHLGFALHAYTKPPKPYYRPGILRQKPLDDRARAYLQGLIDRQGATERPMTLGRVGGD